MANYAENRGELQPIRQVLLVGWLESLFAFLKQKLLWIGVLLSLLLNAHTSFRKEIKKEIDN